MRQPTRYICDRCGLKSDYLPMVFPEDYNSRLCEPCQILFRKEYKVWCNDPKPVDPKPKRFFESWFK